MSFIIQPAAGRTINTCTTSKGMFSVNSTPQGALVYIDNICTQHYTPTDECMSVGTRTIKLTKVGYLDKIVTWNVTQGDASVDYKANLSWKLDVAPICQEAEYKCDGYTWQQCRNNAWVTAEANSLRCGYIPIISDPCTLCSTACTDYARCPSLNPDPCAYCTSVQECVGGVCKSKTTTIGCTSTLNCASGQTCVGGVCKTTTTDPCSPCTAACTNYTKCPKATDPCFPCTSACTNYTICPIAKTDPCSPCTNACTNKTLCPTSTQKAVCVGMNRDGSLDPTCIIEKGNEMYLYGAIGLVLLLVLLKKK
jgi:hypothetical protein